MVNVFTMMIAVRVCRANHGARIIGRKNPRRQPKVTRTFNYTPDRMDRMDRMDEKSRIGIPHRPNTFSLESRRSPQRRNHTQSWLWRDFARISSSASGLQGAGASSACNAALYVEKSDANP